MQKKSQADHVTEELGIQSQYDREKVSLPGIKTLHEKSTTEIAESLAIILKSRMGIVEMNYKVGEFIELVTIPLNR